MRNRTEQPSILFPAGESPAQYDCDCACALSLPQDTAQVKETVTLTSTPKLQPIGVQDGWQAFFNSNGPVGVTVLNREARRVLDAFDPPAPPQIAARYLEGLSRQAVQDAIQNLVQLGLLRPSTGLTPRQAQPAALSAWLHITEACNLACPYCYVHKRPRCMSLHVGYRAIDRLVEAAVEHGYTTLKIKYAGGEPTLKFSLVLVLHDYARRQADRAGLDLEEVILSNGFDVTDEMLDFFAAEGIELMVSLDGDSKTHDRLRASRDGQSSHAAVTNTVQRALDRGIQPRVSITITALNLDGVLEAVNYCLSRGLPFNLNFYRECIGADSEAPALLLPDPARLVHTLHQVFDLIKNYPFYPRPLTGILDRTRLDLTHRYPCSAGRDYLVIDAEGRISACQMLLEEPWTDLEDDTPLDTIRRLGSDVFGSADEEADCQSCPWRYACAGGCPLMRKTLLHSHYCQVYRALFPELIQLEARRLIAAQAPAVATA